MEWTDERRRALYDDGFVRLPGVVPRDLVQAALRAINSSLGDRGLPPEDLPILRSQSYCPELQGDPAITGLLTASPLWSLAEAAIGVGQVRPVERGQIALRFPPWSRRVSRCPTWTACIRPPTGSLRALSPTSPR